MRASPSTYTSAFDLAKKLEIEQRASPDHLSSISSTREEAAAMLRELKVENEQLKLHYDKVIFAAWQRIQAKKPMRTWGEFVSLFNF